MSKDVKGSYATVTHFYRLLYTLQLAFKFHWLLQTLHYIYTFDKQVNGKAKLVCMFLLFYLRIYFNS